MHQFLHSELSYENICFLKFKVRRAPKIGFLQLFLSEVNFSEEKFDSFYGPKNVTALVDDYSQKYFKEFLRRF